MMKMQSLFVVVAVVGFMLTGASAAILADDAYTVGLWHMDTVTEYPSPSRFWQDDDASANAGRDNDLALFSSNQPESLLVADGYDGQAMEFNGVDEYARTLGNNWVAADSIRIEFWFNGYSDLSGGGLEGPMAVDAGKVATTRLQYDNGKHMFHSWIFDNSGTYTHRSLEYVPNEWTHVIIEADGVALSYEMTVESPSLGTQTVTATMNDTIMQSIVNGRIYVGNDSSTSRYFNGKIDELKVGLVPEPATLALMGLGVGMLSKRRKS